MKSYFTCYFLIISLCIASCSTDAKESEKSVQDSNSSEININYNFAVDKTNNLSTRLDKINSAYALAKNEVQDSLLRKVLQKKTALHSTNKELDSAITFAREYLTLATLNQDSVQIGNAYYKLGLYHDKSFKPDSAFFYYNESKRIFESLRDSLQVGRNLTNMSILTSNSSSYSQSDELAVEGIKFLSNTKNHSLKASLYNCIAINAKKQQEYKEALYWYEKAMETTNSNKYRNIYLGNEATIYRILGDYERSIAINQRLLEDHEILNDPKDHPRILDNLTYAKWQQTHDPSLQKDFYKALTIRENENNKAGQITSHSHLSEFLAKNDLPQSRKHAKKMYALASEIDNIDDRLDALQLLMISYEAVPKTYNAYAKRYMFLKDSIHKVRSQLTNKYAKIKFDTAQNRTENEALRIKSVEEQLALEKSKRMNSIYIALGVISLFVFAFILLLLRERHEKEKLEEVVLTETRISKKVHDEVANDIYKTMTKLEKQPMENDSLLNDLEQIYSKTRDISRENSALDLEQDFGELLSDLLMSYKNDDINIITKGLKQVSWNKTSALKKTAIFRVIQELMTNMRKHSQAQIVIITFDETKHKVLIKYSDDGIGCAIKKNNGLLNAENRISSLRGKFTLQSEKDKGFKATIII